MTPENRSKGSSVGGRSDVNVALRATLRTLGLEVSRRAGDERSPRLTSTPGGTRTPNLLIRSQTGLTLLRVVRSGCVLSS